jgi:6-phosphogluconolactonase (cycloisomerase 2 family)
VVANILVGVRPRSAVFTKDSKTVYATAEISGEVVRVDMQKNTMMLRRLPSVVKMTISSPKIYF